VSFGFLYTWSEAEGLLDETSDCSPQWYNNPRVTVNLLEKKTHRLGNEPLVRTEDRENLSELFVAIQGYTTADFDLDLTRRHRRPVLGDGA
jgi:hypothetical protein